MALSFGGGRRRWVCRAARRGGRGGAGCRHFRLYYHTPRQVCTFSPLRWLPRCSLLPYLLIPLVLFFAVLAFLVCFGWFTLVYFVSSLLSKGDDHGCLKSVSIDRAGDADELCRKDEHGGKEVERAVKLLTESAGDSAVEEVCVERQEIKELFVDGFSEESWQISRMASPGICIDHEEHADDEKVVKEVTILETNCEGLKAIAGSDVSSERLQVQDSPIYWLAEQLSITEFRSSRNTAKFRDVPGGKEFVANRKEVSVYTSSENFEFIDKHETKAIVVNVCGNDLKVRGVTSSDESVHDGLGDEHKKIRQEQSKPELPVNSVANKLPKDVFDERQETQNEVTEHNYKLPVDDSMEEDRNQIVGISDEAPDSACERAGSALDSVCQDKSESVATSNASFHLANSDQDDTPEEELAENKRTDSSSSASAVCDVADNLWRIIEELAGFANEENILEEGSPETLVLERVEDEHENNNDNCTSMGEPRRLPLVRRTPAPWWNLCGVLDVFSGGED